MNQSDRAAFAALPLEERLRRTCAGCGLPEVGADGRCARCGAVKDAKPGPIADAPATTDAEGQP